MDDFIDFALDLTPDQLEKLEAKLADPLWRLCSGELYKIAPADGSGVIPFRPRPEQIRVLEAIHGRLWSPGAGVSSPSKDRPACRKIMIPKARRLGMSTVLGIEMVDRATFGRGQELSLVDQNADDAARKLDRIMKVALQNLPPWLKIGFEGGLKDNDSHLSISLAGRPPSNIYAGKNARGSSNDFLWISEWGVIQQEDPKRSHKIRTGALPSARHGIIIVETTWKGGKGGDVWELLEPSLSGRADDWTVLFFPWWVDPRNVSENASIDDDAVAYFERISDRAGEMGVSFTEEQMRWWARERREQGIFMMQENPTFIDECWSAPVKGSIYGEALDRARAEGRVATMPVAGDCLVHTCWDLGAPANTVTWYFQVVGREIRIVDIDCNWEGTLTQRIAMIQAKGYAFGTHFLPHDCTQTERTGQTLLGELRKIGLTGQLVPVPKTNSIWVGINHLLQLFPSLQFRSPQVDEGLEALSSYHQRPPRDGIATTNEPVHDWSSHFADALRTMAEAHLSGLFKFSHTPAKPNAMFGGRMRRGLAPRRFS